MEHYDQCLLADSGAAEASKVRCKTRGSAATAIQTFGIGKLPRGYDCHAARVRLQAVYGVDVSATAKVSYSPRCKSARLLAHAVRQQRICRDTARLSH